MSPCLNMSMMDPMDILCRLASGRRSRFLSALYGESVARPGKAFLLALSSAMGMPCEDYLYFGIDVELDTLYAAFALASCPGAGVEGVFPVMDDRRGLLELDGSRFDAVLVYPGEGEGAPWIMVMVLSRMGGKWAGHRIRRIMHRLDYVFGNDGRALPQVRPRLAVLGPEYPGPKDLALWPTWVRGAEGRVPWIPLKRTDGELRIKRCDKRGKTRRMGDYWTLTAKK